MNKDLRPISKWINVKSCSYLNHNAMKCLFCVRRNSRRAVIYSQRCKRECWKPILTILKSETKGRLAAAAVHKYVFKKSFAVFFMATNAGDQKANTIFNHSRKQKSWRIGGYFLFKHTLTNESKTVEFKTKFQNFQTVSLQSSLYWII